MNMKALKTMVLGVFLLSVPAIAPAQSERLEDHPGYLNLNELIENNEQFIRSEVYLQNYILKMIAKLARSQEPEFAKMLSSIQLIRVLEFDFDEIGLESSTPIAQNIMDYLAGNRWDTLVRSREENSNVNICIQSDREDHIYALAIISQEGTELSIVNIVGDIDLEMLARLGQQFDIDTLRDVEKSVPHE